MKSLLMTLLTLCLLSSPSLAFAFGISQAQSGDPVKWHVQQVNFELDEDGTSDISNGSDLTAFRKSVQSWNDVSCSDFILNEWGTTRQTATVLSGASDGRNRIVWIEDDRWTFGARVLGVTMPLFDYYGEIMEEDFAFYGYSSSWATNGDRSRTDIESVAVHELGHFFGLQHVLGGERLDDPPTMSPFADPYLRTRDLTIDDASAICFLYPAATAPFTCAATCDCPTIVDRNQQSGQEENVGQMACNNNSCGGIASAPSGQGLGGGCNGDNDCTGSLFCQNTGGGGNYCAQSCNPNANDCPNSFTCYPYQNSNQGACLPSQLNGGGGAGQMCLSNSANGSGGFSPPLNGGNGGSNGNGSSDGGINGNQGNNGGGSGSTNNGVCECDTTTICDGDCACDPECFCECDSTTVCDDNCDCDPECGWGCGALPEQRITAGGGQLPLELAAYLMLFAVVFLRKKR